MRMVRSSLVIFVLALIGCAGDLEPEMAPTTGGPQPTAPIHRSPVPPTADELQAYRQDMARMFAGRDVVMLRRSRSGGAIAAVEGHANVALVRVNASGALDQACVDNEQDAMQFLTSAGGLEAK